jgi:hypothetical protein
MQHANAKVPQKKPAVVTNTPKSVCPFVALPWIEGDRGNPRVVTLTTSYDFALWE